jgi:hypothetical protein
MFMIDCYTVPRTGQNIGQTPWAFERMDMCAICVYMCYIYQSIQSISGMQKKGKKGKNGCFTPTHTKAYQGRLVTLYRHQQTSWGYGAHNMITVQSGFRTSDLSTTAFRSLVQRANHCANRARRRRIEERRSSL